MSDLPSQSPADDTGPVRALVTGGAGFIGSHLVDALLASGATVTVIDDLSTGRRGNLPERHERLRFIEADLEHALGAFGPGERFDEIYHLAAAVGVKRVMDDPVGSIEINVGQTAAMLRYALGHGARHAPPRVLIASSSEVYGKSDKQPFCEDDDVVYGPTTVTRWSYACSKAIDEFLALAHADRSGLPCVVARFFNTVGPRQVGRYGMVLPRFVASAMAGEPLRVHGDGSQSRCFADVRDVITALPALVRTSACHGRVFNVGSDQPITIHDLARAVIATLSSRSEIETIPYDRVYPSGFEDLRQRRPDLSRVRDAVGYEPKIPLEQTIRDLADWIATSSTDDAPSPNASETPAP